MRAPCTDCGKDTEPMTKNGRPLFKKWDIYIVRDTVWSEAGMDGWGSGWLCTTCLSKRLGRELTDDDYLHRITRATSAGLVTKARPEYLERIGATPHPAPDADGWVMAPIPIDPTEGDRRNEVWRRRREADPHGPGAMVLNLPTDPGTLPTTQIKRLVSDAAGAQVEIDERYAYVHKGDGELLRYQLVLNWDGLG